MGLISFNLCYVVVSVNIKSSKINVLVYTQVSLFRHYLCTKNELKINTRRTKTHFWVTFVVKKKRNTFIFPFLSFEVTRMDVGL
jgi:hypothetical protein